jgi:hypothetical protein
MTSVASTFNEFLEKAGGSFDESFKRVSNSFDESFKQVQATYDEVVRNTGNPYFLAPDRTANGRKKHQQEQEKSSYGNAFYNSVEGNISSISSWCEEKNAPIARFRRFDSDHRRSGKLTMASIAATSKQPSNSTPTQTSHVDANASRKPFDESSESATSNSIVAEAQEKILQHFERQEQYEKGSLSDEDSNKSSSKRVNATSDDKNNKRTSFENFLGYHSQRTVTRTKLSMTQPVGLDFMTLKTRAGTMLIVSKIQTDSLFATSSLGVGDAVLSINGVTFRSGVANCGGDNICRPDVAIAQRLLEKGWDGRHRDHRGRNNPTRVASSNREDRLKVTIEYQKFDGGHPPSPSPVPSPSREGKRSATPHSELDEKNSDLGDDNDNDFCATGCSSEAVAAVTAVTTDSVTPSRKEWLERKSLLWGPARALLKRSRTPTKSRKSRPASPAMQRTSTSGRISPPKIVHPQKGTAASPSSATNDRSSSSRLAELRSKHTQLRESSNQKLDASRKRLLSAHIEAANGMAQGEKTTYSCESPASLGTQLEQDKKTLFDEKVESMKRELLSSVEKQTKKEAAASLLVDTSTSDDEYKLARTHQETLITNVQNLSIVSTVSDFDVSPEPLDREQAKNTTVRTPSRQSRAISLLDDASWSTLEYLEKEAGRRNTTAQILGEHHQELIRLNKKVSEKLRSKVDLLKRSNMKLAEEVAELRKEDGLKTEMLSSWQKQMEDEKHEKEALHKTVELYKSQLRICSLQSDKRQQELLAQIEKQEEKASGRAEMLLQRIGILEQSNRKLMTRLQNADKSHRRRNVLEEEMKQLRQKLASQTETIESLLHSNDDMTTKNLELERQLNEWRNQKEETSLDSLTAELAICTARTSFLERQARYFREQLNTVKEEAQLEREKRMWCQRELEDALVKLNDPASPNQMRNLSIVSRPKSMRSEDDAKDVSGQSDGSNSVMG